MQKIDLIHNKFAVIGLGDTGLSIINYLNHHRANIGKLFDTRDNPPHQDLVTQFNIPLICGKLDYANFSDIDVIVISPGVSIYEPVLQQAIASGKLVVGDIELFAQAIANWQSKVIGITGSNGKTTVTTLCGFIGEQLGLKTLVAGNIGTPVLTSYLEITKNNNIPQLIVLELSSFQLETCYTLRLDSATVLNISEDHLDRYKDLLEYAYAKSRIFDNASAQVLNSNDQLVMAMSRHNLEKIYCDERVEFPFSKINLIGKHNHFNCIASIALLHAAGIGLSATENSTIEKALGEFRGLEHRMQKVLEHKGVIYIDDSKGTNVGAVCAGINGLNMPVHLILGGDGKGQDFTPLRKLVQDKCSSVAIIGQDKLAIARVLDGLDVKISQCETLEAAIDVCMINAQSGDAIVLSPACASWDMFENYKHRAQVFVDYINAKINQG